jgi:hypothetical protein
MMKQHVLGVQKYSFSRPKLLPYLISPSQENHGVFLGSLISLQYSRSSGHAHKEENEVSFIHGSPP